MMMTRIYHYIGLAFLVVLIGTVASFVFIELLPLVVFAVLCLAVGRDLIRRSRRW